MNKIPGFIFLVLIFSCTAKTGGQKQQENSESGKTTIEFSENVHDFGSLKAGEIVVHTIEFTNTGKTDFVIETIDCTCGCVRYNFMKDAVKPGKKGWIELEFDTSGLAGREYKTIEVHGNSNELKHLAIFAEVENELIKIKY